MQKPFRSQNAAVTAEFFIAPLMPGIFIPLVGRWTFPPDVIAALVVYVIALPFIFILGLPLFLLFSRIRMFTWWGSILAGALGGIAILALLGRGHNLYGFSSLRYGLVGTITGLTFWGVVMLGPEPNQFTARNWIEPFRRRR